MQSDNTDSTIMLIFLDKINSGASITELIVKYPFVHETLIRRGYIKDNSITDKGKCALNFCS